jgi:hypothetical protein
VGNDETLKTTGVRLFACWSKSNTRCSFPNVTNPQEISECSIEADGVTLARLSYQIENEKWRTAACKLVGWFSRTGQKTFQS